MSRTIVIGDVHGCCRELAALLSACELSGDDELVLVGDLVAKGPDSAGVLRLVRSLGARAVLGNHDQILLAYKRGADRGQAAGIKPSHRGALESLQASDWELLGGLPLWLRLPQHQAIVVHAGLVPGVPLEKQEREHLLHLRSIRPDGSLSRAIEERPWASVWPGPELVLFGHDARRGLQCHPHAIGLDTGCVYGGHLTACVLPERRLVSVPAERCYLSRHGGP